MKYLKSAKGHINTEAAWREWVDFDFWKDMQRASWGMRKYKPVDAWERAVKVIGLVEIPEDQVDKDNLNYLGTNTKTWMQYHNVTGI